MMDSTQPVYVIRDEQQSKNGVSTESMILLFILLLVFLCMVLLAVTFCRLGSMERSVDMLHMAQMHRYAAPLMPVPSAPPLPYAPLQPPARSELFNPYA